LLHEEFAPGNTMLGAFFLGVFLIDAGMVHYGFLTRTLAIFLLCPGMGYYLR
jgi:hypothetical protein